MWLVCGFLGLGGGKVFCGLFVCDVLGVLVGRVVGVLVLRWVCVFFFWLGCLVWVV